MRSAHAHQSAHAVVRPGRYVALRIAAVFALLLSVMGTAILAGRPQSAGAQDLALQTAEAAPADTLLYATLNADPESDQLVTGQRLIQAAGVPEILDFLEINFDDMGEFGVILDAAAGGEVAVAVGGNLGLADVTEAVPVEDVGIATPAIAPDEDGEAETVVVIVRAVDPAAAYETARGLLTATADLIGEDITVSEYNGTTIESVVVPEAAATAEDEDVPDSFAIAQVGDFVLIAQFEEHLHPAIDAASGEAESLADQQTFQDVRAQLEGDYLLYGYADGASLGASLDAADDSATGSAAAGADALQGYTGLRVWADEAAPGIRFDTATVPAEGADWEAGEVGFDTTLDERVPDTTFLYAGGNNFGESLVGALLIALVVDFAASMETSDGLGTPVGVSPATEFLGDEGGQMLLELFSGEYAVALSVPGVEALIDPNQIFILVTSGVSNEITASAFVAALDQVIQSSAGENTTFDTVDIGDATVYQATNDETGFPIVVQYGVVNGQFVIGFGDTLETYFVGIEDTLVENPQYIQTFDALTVPGEGGGRIYVDLLQLGSLIQTFGALFSFSEGDLQDASPACAEYGNQAEAQEAYEADPTELLDLDQDFDGEACEDYFAAADAGTPVPTLDTLDLSGLVSYGQVQYEDGDVRGTRGLLLLDVD